MSVTLGPINERSTAKYTSDPLLDEDGVYVPGAVITTATLTLYDLKSGKIINSRNAQNVNQANGVTISSLGVVTWTMVPADNAIIDDRMATEVHVAVFDFRWDGGTSRAVHEVRFLVKNIGMVTS
jgi:hypothetical protein